MNKIEQHTKKRRKENKNRPKLLRYPELVVFAGRTLFYEGAEIGGDVAVVWKLFQDVDLQFDFLFLVLEKKRRRTTKQRTWNRFQTISDHLLQLFYLGNVHDFDGGKLTRLGVTSLHHWQTITSLKSGSDNNLSFPTQKQAGRHSAKIFVHFKNNNNTQAGTWGASVQLMFQHTRLKSWERER